MAEEMSDFSAGVSRYIAIIRTKLLSNDFAVNIIFLFCVFVFIDSFSIFFYQHLSKSKLVNLSIVIN
jgi:hypothetical protein